MILSELLSTLSYGELSNLSLANDGNGEIKEESIPKIVGYINDGLTRLYSRFVLKQDNVIIEMVDHLTRYHLIEKYTESQGTVSSDTPHLFIKDGPVNARKFKGDVLRILKVFDSYGREYPLNDSNQSRSVFTPQPEVLQVPKPIAGVGLSIIYQAKHVPLDSEELDAEVIVPTVLESALKAFVAHKVFSHMNGQENAAKGAEHMLTFESICQEVLDRDVTNESESSTNNLFEQRGFI